MKLDKLWPTIASVVAALAIAFSDAIAAWASSNLVAAGAIGTILTTIANLMRSPLGETPKL